MTFVRNAQEWVVGYLSMSCDEMLTTDQRRAIWSVRQFYKTRIDSLPKK